MKSLNGTISGNGFIVQNSSKSVIARGSFNVTDIDVNKAFTTFHNFGQDFLKAENLAGTLSGSLVTSSSNGFHAESSDKITYS